MRKRRSASLEELRIAVARVSRRYGELAPGSLRERALCPVLTAARVRLRETEREAVPDRRSGHGGL